MKPKDKAKELTLKFMKIDSDSEKFDEFEMKLFYAQRCALIAVDEIIKALEIDAGNWIKWNETKKYWQEVKQEILAL